MKRSIILVISILFIAAFNSCGNKGQETATLSDSTEVSFAGNDTVLYGFAGSECTDSILDFISPGSDPVLYNILEARKRGDIIGNFNTGDQVAVVLSQDGKSIVKAVDTSSLVGEWLTGDSIGDPKAHGFRLSEDGSANTVSEEAEKMRYSKWDVRNARLVLTKSDVMKKHAKLFYDTFNIKSLIEDTLVLRKKGETQINAYIKNTKK